MNKCCEEAVAAAVEECREIARTQATRINATEDGPIETGYRLACQNIKRRIRAQFPGTEKVLEQVRAEALRDLMTRCDGPEGVRADGSNIQTMQASAVLHDLGEDV